MRAQNIFEVHVVLISVRPFEQCGLNLCFTSRREGASTTGHYNITRAAAMLPHTTASIMKKIFATRLNSNKETQQKVKIQLQYAV